MKKLLLAVFTVLICGIMMSSCSRVCTCTGYVAGLPITEYEEDIKMGEKCSSLNTYDETFKSGTKCR